MNCKNWSVDSDQNKVYGRKKQDESNINRAEKVNEAIALATVATR